MRTNSNWPDGVDYGHSNFTGRPTHAARYEGVGGWAKASYRIRPLDVVLYVGGTAAAIWAVIRIARWIWG